MVEVGVTKTPETTLVHLPVSVHARVLVAMPLTSMFSFIYMVLFTKNKASA